MEIFSKILSDTDVGARLAIPYSALQNIRIDDGNDYVDLPVLYNNEQWSFRCSITRNGRPKPVFTGCWLEFVRKKGLRVGDIVIFHMQDNRTNGVQYRIEVKRKINLLGNEVWADVYTLLNNTEA